MRPHPRFAWLPTAVVALMMVFAVARPASAATISLSGNFSVGPGLFDLGTLSVTFSATYDDSTVPPTGFFSLFASLDSVVVSPDYGGFNLTNSGLLIGFEDGSLASAPFVAYLLGFDIDGLGPDDIFAVQSGTNDFGLTAGADGIINDFAIARAGFITTVDENSGIPFSGSITAVAIPVPEPASLLLLGTGLAAAGVRRRLKKRG